MADDTEHEAVRDFQSLMGLGLGVRSAARFALDSQQEHWGKLEAQTQATRQKLDEAIAKRDALIQSMSGPDRQLATLLSTPRLSDPLIRNWQAMWSISGRNTYVIDGEAAERLNQPPMWDGRLCDLPPLGELIRMQFSISPFPVWVIRKPDDFIFVMDLENALHQPDTNINVVKNNTREALVIGETNMGKIPVQDAPTLLAAQFQVKLLKHGNLQPMPNLVQLTNYIVGAYAHICWLTKLGEINPELGDTVSLPRGPHNAFTLEASGWCSPTPGSSWGIGGKSRSLLEQ